MDLYFFIHLWNYFITVVELISFLFYTELGLGFAGVAFYLEEVAGVFRGERKDGPWGAFLREFLAR
jgi:hypothetical protein